MSGAMMGSPAVQKTKGGKYLSYIFDVERPYFEDDRVVWGLKVRFRVLGGDESVIAEEVAGVNGTVGGQEIERRHQWLARSILQVGDTVYEPVSDDDPEALNERLKVIRAWPEPLIATCTARLKEVVREFTEQLESENLGNS